MPVEVLLAVLVLPAEAIVKALLSIWGFLLGLLHGDLLQWPSWITLSPRWTLTRRSLPAYIKLQKVTSKIFNDHTLTDYTLEQRAYAHLEILERPEFAKWNHPRWLAPMARARMIKVGLLEELVSAVTARRFFHAMLQTADEFRLDRGRRYACAEVCACVRLAKAKDPFCPSRNVALELHSLLFTVWFWAMRFPFHSIGPDTHLLPVSPDNYAWARERMRPVMRRDRYTCFMTGTVDRDSTWVRRVSARTVGRLYSFPIFIRSVTDNPSDRQLGPDFAGTRDAAVVDPASQYQTLHFFRTFGEIARGGAQVPNIDMPQNCLLLKYAAGAAFRQLQWTLLPTPIPNTYQIRTYTLPDGSRASGTAHLRDYVTFVEPEDADDDHGGGGRSNLKTWREGTGTGPGTGTLPDPNLLRAHAIFANIVHLSGLGFMYDPEQQIRDLRPMFSRDPL
ncbi:hypothetical protein L226DRAFT_611244 [Lentinus tigrinus ALCF2SS1-7]|uniref:uncharacterized protein n=1 Tax=Lentinus tigrinus ALCF2SS1-7 TaxID=1328758 RepID=UPI001165E495|nr:hypothetical protein L226DRAFT_611244 [Lentinus tigrinus ALCF2SS1-7]